MRYLRWISLLTILALLCAMVPASLAEDFAVDMEEEDFVEETVEEVDSLDLSDLMFEEEVPTPENNDLDLLDADLYEADGEEQVTPAVAANASSDFEIDEDGVLVRYTGFDKNVTIPSGVKEIGDDAFRDDTTLESVTIPSSVTYIGYYAFSGCTKLKSITIPDNVAEIGEGAFSGCTSLTSVQLSSKLTEIGDSLFSGCDSLKTIVIPKGIKTIESNSFSGCKNLQSVTIPDSVTSIKSYAFSYCDSLESITIPSSITSIDRNAFVDGSDIFVIRGVAGSYAEKYATGVGIPFNAPIILFSDYSNDYIDTIIVRQGQSKNIKNTQKPSDLATTLKWSSSNTKVATVDQNGNVKGIKEGSANITVTTADGKGKAASIEVCVPELSIVEIYYDTSEIGMGETAEFSAYLDVSYADDDNSDIPITWSVSDKTILSITKTKKSDGEYIVTVKGLKPGKAALTASSSDGGKDSITVEVLRPEPDSVTINQKGPITLKAGKKYTLTAKVLPAEADQKVTWYSNDTDVAIVSKTGVVTAVSGGEATIWVETDNYCSDSIEIRVPPVPPTSVKLNRTKATVGVSDILVLSTSLLPKNASSECTITSSNPKVISVGLFFYDGAFLVAHKKGKATITVKTENGKKAKCVVTVKAAPKKVTLYKGSKKMKNKQTLTLKKGKTLKLKAKLPAKTAASLTWTSSKPTVATVDENGKITALKPGTTTITVKTHNKKTAKVKIKVK